MPNELTNFLDIFGNQHNPGCECCAVKMTGCTSTFILGKPHKWTRKEIESRIIELSEELVRVRWWNRGDIRRQLKHWTEKLARFKELKEEFN